MLGRRKLSGCGSTAAQMTPTRIALKPLAARNAASSSPNPSAEGSYGGTLYTWLSPCRMTARPSASVIQRPA